MADKSHIAVLYWTNWYHTGDKTGNSHIMPLLPDRRGVHIEFVRINFVLKKKNKNIVISGLKNDLRVT